MAESQLLTWTKRCGKFARSIFAGFLRNKGLLLAGGVGYNALLSIIPLLIILLGILSRFFAQEQISRVVAAELLFIIPLQTEQFITIIQAFSEGGRVINWVLVAILLLFSSLAFRMFEDAIAIIFRDIAHHPRRSFWKSALLPYLFITVLGLGLMLITALTTSFAAMADRQSSLLGFNISLTGMFLSLFGYCGIILMCTLLYKITPLVDISWRRAFGGGIIAASLWEGTRHAVVWYLENISMVKSVYGSISTVIVVLLLMEVAAAILLLGAQTIALLEKNAKHGLPWYSAS